MSIPLFCGVFPIDIIITEMYQLQLFTWARAVSSFQWFYVLNLCRLQLLRVNIFLYIAYSKIFILFKCILICNLISLSLWMMFTLTLGKPKWNGKSGIERKQMKRNRIAIKIHSNYYRIFTSMHINLNNFFDRFFYPSFNFFFRLLSFEEKKIPCFFVAVKNMFCLFFLFFFSCLLVLNQ